MKDYFKPQKIVADYLYFYIDGNKYVGNGIVSWDADTGFSLEGFLDKRNSNFSPIEIRHLKVSTSSDFCSIRIWTKDLGWALIPQVIKSQLLIIPLQEIFYIHFPRFILCENSYSHSDQNYWKGRSLYRVNLIDRFPDSVTKEIKLGNILMKSESSCGFLYEGEETKTLLNGYFLDEENFQLDWSFQKQNYTKSEAWHWSLAFQDALQIWLGQNVQLLKREMTRRNQKIVEVRKAEKLKNLGTLSFFGKTRINKDILLHLTMFFCRKEDHHELCKNIFLQIFEASRQELQITKSLLVATTLEAIIRTIYKTSIKQKDESQKKQRKSSSGFVETTLNGYFKGDYLSKEWTKYCTKAQNAFKNLRDINAHPDWITSEQGMMSDEEKIQTLDDMIYLCRFYGYMILAISGIRGLDPEFPKPHQEWQPSTIIQSYNATQNQPYLESSWIDELSEKLSNSKNRHQKMMAWRKVYKN